MRKIFVVVLVVFAIGLNACNKSGSNTNCNYDPCAIKAPANEITQLETYLSGAGITTAVKHCSGLYYQISAAGADKTPGVCSYVTVNYKGMLTNGNVFDQTTPAGGPASFTLLSLIEGWKMGIPLIKQGGKIRLYLPPSLGYGSAAVGSIPANSILIFDIELLGVQ
jgi:FKBP-type peptidyl-prolyl cis-trans isomerase FkpA